MIVVDRQHAFERALDQDDTGLLLAALLRLIVAVEQVFHAQLHQIQMIEPADNPDLYHDTIQRLMKLDLLAYVSRGTEQETNELRQLLDSPIPATIIAWYERQWSARVTTTTDIIVSIASALRTGMTVIYGNIHLLREYTKPNRQHQEVYQQIVTAVDTLRACRNELRNHLATRGVDIQLF